MYAIVIKSKFNHMNGPRFENFGQNRYFGKEYEFDLLGKIDTENPLFQAELEKLQKAAISRGYHPKQADSLPFREAVELSKKFQPADPTNPQKDFAREMRLALAEKLGLESDQDMDRLKFYTSVGGPLDAHGIDGFISFVCPMGENREREVMVSFDITKNPDKEEAIKAADLLIGGDIPDTSDEDYKEGEYLKVIDGYARQISQIIQEKTQQQSWRGETRH